MKKLIWIALLASIAFIFTSCWSIGLIANAAATAKAQSKRNQEELYNDLSDSKRKEIIKQLCETYTPQNSVLVYGTFTVGISPEKLVFTQMDTTKPAQYLEYIGSPGGLFKSGTNFFFKPCIPGGRYHATYRTYTDGNTIHNTYYGMQGNTIHDFTAPTKPGLYFYGDKVAFYNWDEYRRTYSNPTTKEKYAKHEKDLKECEIESLKYLLKFYNETAWEEVINNRLQELGVEVGGKK
ncbi:MAG: hypothetical protein J6I73_10615 [Treponema sp.]|nr:hypothetical protein [Treponema sp.]